MSTKISELTEATTIGSSDVVPIVQGSVTKKVILPFTMDANDDIALIGTSQYAAGEGIVFNGNPISADTTFDDYEKGKFTVGFSAGSGTVSADANENTLAYIKIGDMVYVQGRIKISAVSSPSGALAMSTLPFTTASLLERSDNSAFGVPYDSLAGAVGVGIYGDYFDASTTIRLIEQTTTSSSNTLANKMAANTLLYFNFSYEAA